MPTDLFSQVLYSDGEGLVFGDLNNMARYNDARLNDMIFARLTGALGTDQDPNLASENAEPPLTLLAYVLDAGECHLKQGTTGTRLGLSMGTIFQKVTASVTGTDAAFLSYHVGASDVDLTITAGDATNPRIDILQMKLEYVDGSAETRDIEDATTRVVTQVSRNKKRRVQATFSMKNGTAGATPTYPAPDTGYCVVGAIRVPATWTTGVNPDPNVTASAIIRQIAIPLRVEKHTVMPCDFDYNSGSGSGWSLNSAGEAESAGATDLIVWAPTGSEGKRIVGVEIVGIWVTSGQVDLVTEGWTSATHWVATGPTFDLSSQLVTTGGTTQHKFAHLGNICDASSVSNPSAANGVVGDPIWCAGHSAGPAARPLSTNSGGTSGNTFITRAALRIDAGNISNIIAVTWYLAG